jgi:hypothetical protein
MGQVREIAMLDKSQITIGGKVVPLRPLDEMVLLIHKKFDVVVRKQEEFKIARIEAGRLLLELRSRVEAGEDGRVSWWDWYGQKFARSRRDAERVMEIASQEDPEWAYDKMKEKRQQYNQSRKEVVKERGSNRWTPEPQDRKVGKPNVRVVQPKPQEEIQQNLIDMAMSIVNRMNVPTKARFARLFERSF